MSTENPLSGDEAGGGQRAKLEAMKPSALRHRAVDAGITEDALDEAQDASDPKAALIDLILARQSSGAVGAATAPDDCEVMVSFNQATAGEEAIALTEYLERHGVRTFCTAVWCPQGGAGANWRADTIKGVKQCKAYVPLMTDGWQDSNECEFETQRAVNRLAAKEISFVPVRFNSFSMEKDASNNMFIDMIGTSTQFIFKESDPDWMHSVLRGASLSARMPCRSNCVSLNHNFKLSPICRCA